MGCGCKSTDKEEKRNDKLEVYKPSPIGFNNNGTLVVKYIFKIFGFIIALLTIPIIVLAIIWFMFDLIVLNKEVDMAKITNALVSKIKPFNEGYGDYDYDDDENDYDDEEYDEEEYEYIPQFIDDVTVK